MCSWSLSSYHLPFVGEGEVFNTCKTTQEVCIKNRSLLLYKSVSRVPLFVTLWTAACQAPLSMEFSRQEYWSGLPFPTPSDLPNSGIEPTFLTSPILAGRFFTTEPLGKPYNSILSFFLPFHTVHGVLKARILKWVAMLFSR